MYCTPLDAVLSTYFSVLPFTVASFFQLESDVLR